MSVCRQVDNFHANNCSNLRETKAIQRRVWICLRTVSHYQLPPTSSTPRVHTLLVSRKYGVISNRFHDDWQQPSVTTCLVGQYIFFLGNWEKWSLTAIQACMTMGLNMSQFVSPTTKKSNLSVSEYEVRDLSILEWKVIS